jgi:hypothetical protein
MTIRIDNQLVQVYYQEALENAAQARADRKNRPARAKINVRETFFALIAAGVPVVIWLLLFFKAK